MKILPLIEKHILIFSAYNIIIHLERVKVIVKRRGLQSEQPGDDQRLEYDQFTVEQISRIFGDN